MARSRQKHSGPVQRRDLRRRSPWGHQDRSPRPFEARPQCLVEIEARAGRVGMSAAEDLYRASPIRRRHRSTKAEVEARREKLLEIVEAMKPMTVRQVFYQTTVHGIIEKSECGYTKVQTDLTLLRRAGELPYDWLADNTRWQRKPRTFTSPEQALLDTAKFYRKDLWVDADAYVEVWLEKDALAGVIYPTTSMYDVPLMVARGYP